MKNFDTFGVMIDCSRNAVYTVEAMKRFTDTIASMGYNMLMLYTEDTFEVTGEPYFGYFRGRYTQDELRELDAYCASKGVELIPCIQTLAHLERIKRHDVYSRHFDVNDILLVGDDRVYELIDNMLATCEKCFTSRRINIGMDEAHMIGLGKYLDLHGYEDRHSILAGHLEKVNALVRKHGFEPMMWSDMYFRFATGGDYRTDKLVMTEKERAMVPDGMGVIYWDYYTTKPEIYDIMFENHNALSDNVWFAGGIWTWTGFLPHNNGSMVMTRPAIESCKRHGVKNVIMTMWGDNGGECSVFSTLPALYYTSRIAEGETDEASIKEGFRKKFGIAYDDFTKVELPDKVNNYFPTDFVTNGYNHVKNPSKYMLYNDVFYGRYDSVVHFNEKDVFSGYLAEYGDLASDPEYGYLFKMSETLCETLKYKYALGASLRRAYSAGDKTALAACLDDFDGAITALDKFYEAFKAAWMHDKKPAGFEVQTIRLGGLRQRLIDCRARVCDYLDGKLAKIDELEETLLDCDGHGTDFVGRVGFFNNYQMDASQSCLV